MKVSIISPVYNCAPYIVECIQSLLAQTCQDFEVLLVDDHGTDDSISVARAFVEQQGMGEKFRFLQTPCNSGPGIARNIGIEAAKGEYVAFIDADDVWEPTFIEKLLRAAESSHADLAFCQLKYRGGAKDGKVFRNPVVKAGEFTTSEKRHFLLHFVTFSVCFLFRREFLIDNGLRFPSERNSEDTNFLTRCLLVSRRIACIDEPLYVYCIREASLSTGQDKHRYKSRLSALDKLLQTFSDLKQDPRYADLHLNQYDGVMRIIWLKKGLAQSIKDYIKNNLLMDTIKKLWPTLLAIIIFAVVACIYMSPVLDGKIIATSDGVQGRAAVHEAVEYYEQTGNRTWWTGSMFSGMPNYQIGGGKYLKDLWLKPVKDVLLWGHRNVIAIVLLYCLGFFALLRSMKVDKWLSIVGALAIAFSSYFFIIIGANHHSKTSTLALMSAVVAGFYLIFHGHRKTGIVLTLLCSAIGFFPHPQMSYYMCFIIGAFWIAELCLTITSKAWKAFGLSTLLFAAAFGIGLGTGTATIFTNLEYAEETMRGGHSDLEKSADTENKTKGLDLDYATAWSYGIKESWTFLIPNYMGGSSNYTLGKESDLYKDMVSKGVPRKTAEQFCQSVPLYWGDQPFTAGPVYMGAIICLLFVLGLLIVKGPYKWCLLAVTLLSIALSWGNHWMGLTRFFFETVPMYNKFRAVSSILVIAEITMPLLGFLALKRTTEAKQAVLEAAGDSAEQYDGSAVIKDLSRNVLISAGVVVALILIAFITTSGFMGPNDEGMFSQLPDWLVDGIVAERAAMFKADVFRSLGLVLVAAAVVYLYVKSRKFRGTAVLAVILGALILIDMWPVDKRYMNDSMFSKGNTFEQAFKMQPWEKQILDSDKDPNFRVFNLAANTFNDARTSYRMKSIGGYSAAKLRRYQDLIDQHLSKMHWPVLNMLNAKYVIFQDQEGGQTLAQRNPDAMGNAWFVDTLRVVQTANEECDGLMQYDLHHTAVVDKAFAGCLANEVNDGISVNAADSAATVSLTCYTPEYVEYDSRSSKPGTIVFSEIYYDKGWKASIDGEPVDHFRVNYLLRALNVPAGNHHIRFEFRPESVERGNMLSMCFVVAMYLIILACIGMGVKELLSKKQ